MVDLLKYILESSFSLSICYAFYFFFLRKESNHAFVRYYLLAALCFSFAIPFFNFEIPFFQNPEVTFTYYLPTFQDYSASSDLNDTSSNIWLSSNLVLWSIYGTISIWFLASILMEVHRIFKICRQTKSINFKGYKVIYHQTDLPTFSFMRMIFLAQEDRKDMAIEKNILNHEIAHIKGLHSVDILFIEILKIIFWFNPLVYAFKNALVLSHEYIADQQSIQKGDDQSYVNLLVNQTLSNLGLSLGSHFGRKSGILPEWFPFGQLSLNKSITLKRIQMIKNKKKMNKLKYFIPVLAIGLSFIMVSCLEDETLNENQINKPDLSIEDVSDIDLDKDGSVTITMKDGTVFETTKDDFPTDFNFKSADKVVLDNVSFEVKKFIGSDNGDQADIGETFHIVEERPQFVGGDQALYSYLAEQINYPKTASEQGVGGKVFVQFIIKKDGSISDSKIIKGVEESIDQEALRVIEKMPDWIPGKQKGQDVNVQMVIPIKFKLDD